MYILQTYFQNSGIHVLHHNAVLLPLNTRSKDLHSNLPRKETTSQQQVGQTQTRQANRKKPHLDQHMVERCTLLSRLGPKSGLQFWSIWFPVISHAPCGSSRHLQDFSWPSMLSLDEFTNPQIPETCLLFDDSTVWVLTSVLSVMCTCECYEQMLAFHANSSSIVLGFTSLVWPQSQRLTAGSIPLWCSATLFGCFEENYGG